MTLEARDEQGRAETFRGAFLIDASGRGNLTGNQEGLREIHPRLRKLAVFGHFTGVRRDAGEKGGDTVIVRLENKWFWLIPLTAEKVSVGCVLDEEEFAGARETPEKTFTRLWQSSLPLRERMRDARLVGAMHTASDFSFATAAWSARAWRAWATRPGSWTRFFRRASISRVTRPGWLRNWCSIPSSPATTARTGSRVTRSA